MFRDYINVITDKTDQTRFQFFLLATVPLVDNMGEMLVNIYVISSCVKSS